MDSSLPKQAPKAETATNPALAAALADHVATKDNYIQALQGFGVEFQPAGADDVEIALLREKLKSAGAKFANAGASIVWGWQSPACIECTGSVGSETFSTTFKCHRDCYFCFNHNVADYQKYVENDCPWEEGLEQALKLRPNMAAIGLTGGEPLLVLDKSLDFLRAARQAYPQAHLRMYSTGDMLDGASAAALREAGLDEIRFSIKQEDDEAGRAHTLEAMKLAREHFPMVMVEMPIIPGTQAIMEDLMASWDAIGIDGVNFLEFCFPFHSWDQYAVRGFKIRNAPFDVMYDYGYSGGLPVAGSEILALKLMLKGIEKGYSFGMHYCSLDNKHRSEMRQRNERAALLHPCYSFDDQDFFLKCGKVFGEDIDAAFDALRAGGCTSFLDLESEKSLCFPLSYIELAEGVAASAAVSYNVLVQEGESYALQEVDLRPASAVS